MPIHTLYRTIPYRTERYSTLPYCTVPYRTVLYYTGSLIETSHYRYSAVHMLTIRYNALRIIHLSLRTSLEDAFLLRQSCHNALCRQLLGVSLGHTTQANTCWTIGAVWARRE
jgi:hypothetical protein